MTTLKFAKKIRNYSLASFITPLIAINLCLIIYMLLYNGVYPNYNFDDKKVEYTYDEYHSISRNVEARSLTNCPKYIPRYKFVTAHDQISYFENNFLNLSGPNKIKFITIEYEKTLNDQCIKNRRFSYFLLKKLSFLEPILINFKESNHTGFAKVKNPYFYGEISISRTARYFPANLIFKTLIILSAFLLFLYWKNNLNFLNELKNKNTLVNPSKKFFYFGLLSCIFLTLHATFLGINFDSNLFSTIRRLIIALFIFSEIFAQIFLTINLFKFKEELKKYINILILKIKIFFVAIVFLITCVAFTILAVGEPSVAFKHTLEWNYFSFLLLYYLLSRLLWKL